MLCAWVQRARAASLPEMLLPGGDAFLLLSFLLFRRHAFLTASKTKLEFKQPAHTEQHTYYEPCQKAQCKNALAKNMRETQHVMLDG